MGDTLSSGLQKRQGILRSYINTIHSIWGHDSSQAVSHWRAFVGCCVMVGSRGPLGQYTIPTTDTQQHKGHWANVRFQPLPHCITRVTALLLPSVRHALQAALPPALVCWARPRRGAVGVHSWHARCWPLRSAALLCSCCGWTTLAAVETLLCLASCSAVVCS